VFYFKTSLLVFVCFLVDRTNYGRATLMLQCCVCLSSVVCDAMYCP